MILTYLYFFQNCAEMALNDHTCYLKFMVTIIIDDFYVKTPTVERKNNVFLDLLEFCTVCKLNHPIVILILKEIPIKHFMSEFDGKLKTLAFLCQLNTALRSAESSALGRSVWFGCRHGLIYSLYEMILTRNDGYLFSNWKSLGIPRTLFQHVLKSNMLEWAFQRDIFEIFHTLE